MLVSYVKHQLVVIYCGVFCMSSSLCSPTRNFTDYMFSSVWLLCSYTTRGKFCSGIFGMVSTTIFHKFSLVVKTQSSFVIKLANLCLFGLWEVILFDSARQAEKFSAFIGN